MGCLYRKLPLDKKPQGQQWTVRTKYQFTNSSDPSC